MNFKQDEPQPTGAQHLLGSFTPLKMIVLMETHPFVIGTNIGFWQENSVGPRKRISPLDLQGAMHLVTLPGAEPCVLDSLLVIRECISHLLFRNITK